MAITADHNTSLTKSIGQSIVDFKDLLVLRGYRLYRSSDATTASAADNLTTGADWNPGSWFIVRGPDGVLDLQDQYFGFWWESTEVEGSVRFERSYTAPGIGEAATVLPYAADTVGPGQAWPSPNQDARAGSSDAVYSLPFIYSSAAANVFAWAVGDEDDNYDFFFGGWSKVTSLSTYICTGIMGNLKVKTLNTADAFPYVLLGAGANGSGNAVDILNTTLSTTTLFKSVIDNGNPNKDTPLEEIAVDDGRHPGVYCHIQTGTGNLDYDPSGTHRFFFALPYGYGADSVASDPIDNDQQGEVGLPFLDQVTGKPYVLLYPLPVIRMNAATFRAQKGLYMGNMLRITPRGAEATVISDPVTGSSLIWNGCVLPWSGSNPF